MMVKEQQLDAPSTTPEYGRFVVGWTVTAPANPSSATVLADVPATDRCC